MKYKKIIFALLAALNTTLFAMQPEQPMVTLVSADKKEFTIPQAVAEQSGQIKDLLSVHGFSEHESTTKRFEFSTISAPVINEVIQLMLALQRHKNITNKKALLDALEKDVTINYKIGVLKAADLLDIPVIKDLIARQYAKQIQANKKTPGQIRDIIRNAFTAQIANDIIGKIASYYYLLTLKQNAFPEVPEDAYGYSIQDYLDYQSQFIQKRTITGDPLHPGDYGSIPYLNLDGLKLNSLKGLANIPNHGNTVFINLRYNKLHHIPSHAFANTILPGLKYLYLNNSQIQEIDAQAFAELPTLELLNISSNRLTEIDKNVFTGLNNLIALNLSFNNLHYIDPTLFVGLPRLQRLYIDYEKLTPENRQAIKNALPNVELEF